ncbi:MAG: pitrilysin family protein [Peptostreptococcus porci]|nr:pitrilysin family protein [Peptostreptococcus porci]
MGKLSTYELGEGISLALIKNNKFKSNIISIYFIKNLNRDDVTQVSLLSNIMSSGCMKYKSMKEISTRMDELYGMSMTSGVYKIGEKSLSYFKFLSISDRYLEKPILNDVVEFINDIVFNPLIIDGGINPDMLEIEKTNLVDEIQSKINDKKTYALIKCIENMCEGEPYSIERSGYIDDLDSITSKDLYDTYKSLISTSKVLITVEGDIDIDNTKAIVENTFNFQRSNVVDINREKFDILPKKVRYISEDLGTNQGKLVIGYRTRVDYKDFKEYYSLVVGNSIFGGGPHSKLFNNVREKESICYYVSSSIEKSKGLMIVNSGIDVDNYEKALELIDREFESVCMGEFTDMEIDNSKKSIINSLKSSCDSISGESEFFCNQFISQTNLDLDEIIYFVENTSREDIVAAMNKIRKATVYFLK